jgi:hypothetical protein
LWWIHPSPYISAKIRNQFVVSDGPTAKQILNYYDTALRQDDVALFYLYKAVELILDCGPDPPG